MIRIALRSLPSLCLFALLMAGTSPALAQIPGSLLSPPEHLNFGKEGPTPKQLIEARERDQLRGQRELEALRQANDGRTPGFPLEVRLYKWRGTKVKVQESAKGESKEIQEKFAERFAKADDATEGRIAHFDWIGHTFHGSLGDARIDSWHLFIEEARLKRDGDWLIKVKVAPGLFGTGDIINTFDRVHEFYLYSSKRDRFELIDTDAATPRPHLQCFPLARFPY